MLRRVRRALVPIACLGLVASANQSAAGQVLDEVAPPGTNYDNAEFRFWLPRDVSILRAVLVLVPGSNGDGRAMAEDSVWQAFASRNKLAIVACRFTDKPHEQSFIEHYVNVSQGSGQALLEAISRFAERSEHAELAAAPLLFWGMSAGGQFNYEFAAWKPERVLAFVVNKGGIYYTALTPRATREVPAVLFVGGKDLESRTSTITGLFALNRRGGARWALTEEPSAGHIVGRSRDMSMLFFEEVLPLRLNEGSTSLKSLAEANGFLGDFKSKLVRPFADSATPNYPTAWLPTARVARAWLALITEKPFE